METLSPVLILSAGTNGLGVVRSLWKKDIQSAVIVRDADDIALKSRLPLAKHVADAVNINSSLMGILESYSGTGSVIIPTSDWFVHFINAHREQLLQKGFKFSVASKEITDALIDKAQETKLLEPWIPVPKTCQKLPSNPADLLAQLRLPIIFKPRSFEHSQLGSKNHQVYSEEDLKSFYEARADILDSLIAQEIIEGPDHHLWVCNCTFSHTGELLCAFTFRRLKLSPAHYGVTSYAISKRNEEVVELCKKIGQQLSYVGPAMIEFKYDERDGTYQYIELNPRVGMCNFFDTECGINNVYAAYAVALDQPVNDLPKQQRDNVIYIDLYDDIGTRIKGSEESLGQIIKHYFSDLGKKHVFASFAWYDLGPAFSLLPKVIRGCLKALGKLLRLR